MLLSVLAHARLLRQGDAASVASKAQDEFLVVVLHAGASAGVAGLAREDISW